MIPPQKQDFTETHNSMSGTSTVFRRRRWVACLFTSLGYGKKNARINNPGRDSPRNIIQQTREALESLRLDLEDFGESNFNEQTSWQTDDKIPGEIWSCKFNSGAFGVDWEDTKVILNEIFEGYERPFTVVDRINKVDYESDPKAEDVLSEGPED